MAVTHENFGERVRQHPRLPIHHASYSFHRRQDHSGRDVDSSNQLKQYRHSIDTTLLEELAAKCTVTNRIQHAPRFHARRELGTLAGGLAGMLLASACPTLDVHWILCAIVLAGIGTLIGERMEQTTAACAEI